MKIKNLVLLLFLPFLLNSCKKYVDETIPNNIAPPDTTISGVLIETYINKVYISVLGRKPSQEEFSNGFSIVKDGNLSNSSRKEFLTQVMAKPDYFPRIYNIARQELLNDIDTNEIGTWIAIFTQYLTLPDYAAYANELQNEINRLEAMRDIPNLLSNNAPYSVAEMHLICINNYFYDQLNMGTFNFVTSTFEHFLSRSPSDSELEGGSKMVDGFNGVLFFNSGKTKSDYLNIFFRISNDYYQGQVRILFQRYLFREPTSEENTQLAAKYKASGSFQDLQKDILAMDEFAGLKP